MFGSIKRLCLAVAPKWVVQHISVCLSFFLCLIAFCIGAALCDMAAVLCRCSHHCFGTVHVLYEGRFCLEVNPVKFPSLIGVIFGVFVFYPSVVQAVSERR